MTHQERLGSRAYDDVTYVYDDVTYVYDDVTYVYEDVTYVYDDVTYDTPRKTCSRVSGV